MAWLTLTMSLGGLGLLLLGMGMMTDGLKAAAGTSLQAFLERSTRTRMRAALAGFGITALVQSSSAVIVATLGFTNAGMLRLKQAAWVVFGSNVGTTMTAWIVALIGLRLKVEIVALPLIGIGMLLKLFSGSGRGAHIGVALAGFGLLFLGLGMLRDAFIDVADWIPIAQLGTPGVSGIMLGVLFGALLTALIQSSSASLAIILTASVTGVLTPLLGASLVIGANIGTTVTSLLASIGATANARRLAVVHVTEKLLTAVIALILLGPLWWISQQIVGVGERINISTGLALFHTLFNLLGLLLMWLLADQLLRRVERWIKQPELSSEKLRYLDDTVLEVPAMGVGAMHSEIKRVFKQLLARGGKIINPVAEPAPEESIHTGVLLAAIAEYGNRIGARNLNNGLSETFLNLYWAREECVQLRDIMLELAELPQADINDALTPMLREAFLRIMRSGELKQMDIKQRAVHLKDIKRLRRQRRAELLDQIGNGLITAPVATRYLHIVALFEDGAKRILHIAEVIYPEPEQEREPVPETAEAAA
ncbi:MAG: Na/Pi symporter [Haliea sp.]|uniref:Na/Pi cotransporter family protein n=1 Tax=Haliea sp. TaxID=1932666 RepID=UPI0032EC1189